MTLYEFLKKWYKYDRFEGQNGKWCPNYSEMVTAGSQEQLDQLEYGIISRHESKTGEMIIFNKDFEIMENAPKRKKRKTLCMNCGKIISWKEALDNDGYCEACDKISLP